jgi:hypothetical protein
MSAVDVISLHWRAFEPAPRPRYVGVYFLIDRNEIVYVGQSIDIELRIMAHRSRRPRPGRRNGWRFDRATWIELTVEDLDAYERALIRLLVPRYNRRIGASLGRDSEVAERFGLQAPDPERVAAFMKAREKSYPRGAKSAVSKAYQRELERWRKRMAPRIELERRAYAAAKEAADMAFAAVLSGAKESAA